MKLRRGFKTEAEEYAEEFRVEMSLPIDGPLCPFQLAEYLAIPVVKLSELPDLPPACLDRCFSGQSEFSATTVNDGPYRMIVHNDSHHPHRQNSNVMHEIAHVLLGHPSRPPLTGDGCRHFDSMMEREANELGFTLLVPKRAALRVVETRIPTTAACMVYGVSPQLLNYRISITDVRGWAANRRRLR